MSLPMPGSMQMRSATTSREGCRGRSCDHSLAEAGRLESSRVGQLQSFTSAHRLVRWPSPSKVIEPRRVPGSADGRRSFAAIRMSATAVAVEVSGRGCWSTRFSLPASEGARNISVGAFRPETVGGHWGGPGDGVGAVARVRPGRSAASEGGRLFCIDFRYSVSIFVTCVSNRLQRCRALQLYNALQSTTSTITLCFTPLKL